MCKLWTCFCAHRKKSLVVHFRVVVVYCNEYLFEEKKCFPRVYAVRRWFIHLPNAWSRIEGTRGSIRWSTIRTIRNICITYMIHPVFMRRHLSSRRYLSWYPECSCKIRHYNINIYYAFIYYIAILRPKHRSNN